MAMCNMPKNFVINYHVVFEIWKQTQTLITVLCNHARVK